MNRPIVLGFMTTVKTHAFCRNSCVDVSRPNGSRYEGLLVVTFILLNRVFQLLNTTFNTVLEVDSKSFVQLLMRSCMRLRSFATGVIILSGGEGLFRNIN